MALSCEALGEWVNLAHWWTAKDISGLLLADKYNIIPTIELYLHLSLLGGPVGSEPKGLEVSVGVVLPLQSDMPVAFNILLINPT